MRRIYKLYKAIKNGSDVFNSAISGKSKFATSKLFQWILTGAILVAFIGFGYFLLGDLYDAMGNSGFAFGLVLMMFLQISTLMVLVMSILYAPSMLFMGDDNKILLPLPVRPWELLLAKMMVLYTNMLQIVALFAIPIFLCSGILLSKGISFYLYGLLVTLVVPCIPLAIACLLSVLLISIAPIKINKDVLTLVSTFIMLGGVILFNVFSNNDPDALLNFFMKGKLTGTLSYVFPNINMSLQLFSGKNVFLNLLLLIVVFIGSFALISFALQKPFYKALSSLQDVYGYKKGAKLEAAGPRRGQFSAYFKKEMRMLTRTTANITYLFLLGLYMPVLLFVMLVFVKNLKELLTLINFANPMTVSFVFWVFMGVMAWQCGYIQAGLTTISKEGKNLYIMKYLPMKMKTQLLVKLLVSMLVFLIPLALLLAILIFVVKPPALLTVALTICSLAMILCTTLAEMLFDIKNPKLTWLSEQQMFGGFRMILPLILFIAAFAGLCFGLNFLQIEGYLAIWVTTGLLLLISIVLFPLTVREDALAKLE